MLGAFRFTSLKAAKKSYISCIIVHRSSLTRAARGDIEREAMIERIVEDQSQPLVGQQEQDIVLAEHTCKFATRHFRTHLRVALPTNSLFQGLLNPGLRKPDKWLAQVA